MGLGKNVLEALQYAAKGQGLLAGLAILFCAMVIDRIVWGITDVLQRSGKGNRFPADISIGLSKSAIDLRS